MKRRLVFSLFFITFGIAAYGQYVTILGRQFKDENGNNFEPMVCNYTINIVNTDTSDFLTTYISPDHRFGSTNGFECSGTESCDDQLKNDFTQMLYMGFNTVRIMGISPYYLSEGFQFKYSDGTVCWECTESAFYVYTNNYFNGDCKFNTRFALHSPFDEDSVALHLFTLINHLI